MQHPGTDTGPSGPYWGKKEQTVFAPVLLMTGLRYPKTLGSLPLGAILPHMYGLMKMETCQLS